MEYLNEANGGKVLKKYYSAFLSPLLSNYYIQ